MSSSEPPPPPSSDAAQASPAASAESVNDAAPASAESAASTLTALEPTATPVKSKRKAKKRKPRAFTPGVNLTSGLTTEMRMSKSAEEFENDLEESTVNRMLGNVRNVIPSLSDLSSAFSTASKSVSNLSVAAMDATQKASTREGASKSVSELSTAAMDATQKASKSVSELSVAAMDATQKASKSVSDLSVAASGAAKTASEHAFSFGAALSDVSQRMASGAKAAMDTAVAAKQRTTEAYNAAKEGATAMSEKVSAAQKSISETTTALMEGATAAKAKITEVSKVATEKAAAVSASVQENVKKAQEVSKVAIETAAPVVSAVSSGVAAAASSVSDAAVSLSSSASGASSDTNVSSSASSSDLKESIKAATSSAATTALSKFSHLSKSLSSIFAPSGRLMEPSTPRLDFSNKDRNDSEMVALADLCPMPAVAYKASNHSPPTSEGGSAGADPNGSKVSLVGENITVYECEIEQTYQQSTATNSYESVACIKDAEINTGKMVKHPIMPQQRHARPVLLVGAEAASKRVEEWALRQLERAEEVPGLAVPETRLGDREQWMINQIVTRIQNKFMNMKRHDFTIDIKRGFAKNGLPYLEVEVTPISSI